MQVFSLNRQVSFQQVLPLLGSRPRAHALPTLALCPLCKSHDELLISLDTVFESEWAYCRKCKFAGDMITLVAKTWKLGIREALYKLSVTSGFEPKLGDPKEVDNYVQRFHSRMERVTHFWQECQATHIRAETSGLRILQQRLNADNVLDGWEEKGGQFLGSSTKQDVDATFNPVRVAHWEHQKNKRSGSFPSQLLTGGKWADVLVVPFWDLPGRICGFLIIGREANVETDFVYKGVIDCSKDAGLAMLPALLTGAHHRLGHTKFVFTDVDIAMRFHVRHFRDHSTPLPLAAAWTDDKFTTNEVWRYMSGRSIVFWGSDRLKSIIQAKQAKGLVSLVNVTAQELDTNMRHATPVEWLLRMRAKAVPWITALQEYIQPLDDSTISNAFTLLNLPRSELDSFVEGCRDELRERLQLIFDHPSFANHVLFEGRQVCVKSDGWYLSKKDERISNAVVHLEHTLITADKRSYYRGVIKFNGAAYPFTEKTTTLKSGMLSWAQAHLRDHARAGVSEFYPSWDKKSLQLAIKFHAPKQMDGVDVIGWDKANRQFNFPKFAIQAGGVVTTDFACLFDNETLPAQDLPAPGMIPRTHVAALAEHNDETQIFWAVAACVAANVIASAVNRNQTPILLSGSGAHGIGGSAAVRLGCQTLRLAERTPRSQPQTRLPDRGVCGWSSLVDGVLDIAQFGMIDQEEAKNCIFNLNAMAGKVVALRGRANLITHNRQLGSLQLLHHAALFVIPNYIQDLYKRNIFLPGELPDLAADVLHDMADWFSQLGGDRTAVEAANLILSTPHSKPASDYFCELAFRLFEDGELSHKHASFEALDTSTAIVLIDEPEKRVWISQDRFSDAVKSAGGIAPDLLLITKSLAEQEILVSEPSLKQKHGWLVRASWWNLKLQTWRAANESCSDALA